MAFDLIAVHHAAIARCLLPVIMHRISIENFTPASRLVDAKAVVVARNGRKVAGDDDLVTGFITAYKNQYRAFIVIDHQPLKAVSIEIQLMQRFMVAIGVVEIAHH